MHRSHSRHTYPADKPLPKAIRKWQRDVDATPEAVKFEKKFHKRKARQFLKNRLRKDGE